MSSNQNELSCCQMTKTANDEGKAERPKEDAGPPSLLRKQTEYLCNMQVVAARLMSKQEDAAPAKGMTFWKYRWTRPKD